METSGHDDFDPPATVDPSATFEWTEEFDALPVFDRRTHLVHCTVVAHNGAPWLPAVLTTLAAQTAPLGTVVGVDNASKDDSATILEDALGSERVIRLSVNAGFGGAVDAAMKTLPEPQSGDVVEWLWFLHDDSAPDATCLENLLLVADQHPSATILGPKVLGWHDRRLLLEVGFSVNADGRRVTGIERGEHDQGQHDQVRDVLAVSTAGMLIRRDVFTALHGFDPRLPLFRDDLDLCWRAWNYGMRVMVAPSAVLHHREAAAHGRRPGFDHPQREEREAAAHVLIAHAPGIRGPLTALRLLIGSAVRSLVYLLGKDARAAREEISAVADVAFHPGRLRESRVLTQSSARELRSVTKGLRPTTWDQVRGALEAAGGVLTTSNSSVSSSISALDTGPTDDAAAYLPDDSAGLVRRVITKPSVVITSALVLLAIIGTRGLWWGEGVIQGGALLPAPQGASDLWSRYAQAWHDVGTGSTVPAPPYLAVLALLATVLVGKTAWAIAALTLLAIPLAGWAAYFTSKDLISSKVIRVWVAAAYALLPAVTGAIASGRIGTTMVAIVLPFAVRSLYRILSVRGTVRRAAGTALLMTVVLAAAPALWLIAVIVVVTAVIVIQVRDNRERAERTSLVVRAIVSMIVPFIILMPWTLFLVTHPGQFLLEPGLSSNGLVDPSINAVDVLLLHPGGPGMTPLWVTAGIVVAGLVAILRTRTMQQVLASWVVAGLAFALGTIQTLVLVTPYGSTVPIRPWPGQATLLLGLALIAAAGIGAQGLREQFVGQSFSIAQPLAAIAVVGALLAPLLTAAWWVIGVPFALERAPASNLPAFVAAEAVSPQAPRTLILRQADDERIEYTLVNGAGMSLGDAETPPPVEVWEAIDPLVAAMASGRGGSEVQALAGYGVRYVLLARGASQEIVPTLDGEPGLRRLSNADGEVLWRVAGVTSRARVAGSASGIDGVAPQSPLGLSDSTSVSVNPYIDQALPENEWSSEPRTLVAGVTPPVGWRAVMNTTDELSTVLAAEPWQWSAAFSVPPGPASVRVWFDDSNRSWWLWGQALAVLALVIVALPSRQALVDVDVENDS